MTTEINDNDIYMILPEGIYVFDIITRFKKALPEGIYVPAIIDDIRLLQVPRFWHTHI